MQPADGFPAPDIEITAVHISDLPDPTSYVSGGELLLMTGLMLPSTTIGCGEYVARLSTIGIAALGIGLGPVHEVVPRELIRACREHGLPLLIVPDPTPFLTITKAYWAARARSSEQPLQDAVATHRSLIDAAAAPDPGAEILRRLARALGGWAASMTPAGTVDQIHPAGLVKEAEALQTEVSRLEVAGVHSAASFAAGDRFVAVYPLSVEGRVVGYVAVGTPQQLRSRQRNAVLTAVALLSIDASHGQRTASEREATGRCVAVLVDLGLVDAARQLAAVLDLPSLGREVRLLMVRGRDSNDLGHLVQAWCPAAYSSRTSMCEGWCLLPGNHPPLSELKHAIAGRDSSAVAVVSDLIRLEDVGTARPRLAGRLQALEAGSLDLADVVSGDDHELTARLEAFVAAQADGMMAALVSYLRNRGQWEQASRDLGIHRNTLRYRIGRARDILGVDIDDPDHAAHLWLLLRARGIA